MYIEDKKTTPQTFVTVCKQNLNCKANKHLTLKKIVKCTLFLFIFYILWTCIFNVLWLDKNPITSFYNEPKKSLDIVYIGSSNVIEHFNTTLAYNLYGYTTGLLSNYSQPFVTAKYLIKESEKYQKPKLYIIDITKSVDDVSLITDSAIRNTTDAMKFSKNRIEAINELLFYKNVNKKEYINFYFSFLMYHNSWQNIGHDKFYTPTNLYKGYLFGTGSVSRTGYEDLSWEEENIPLPNENKQILLNLIYYIKNNNLNVLFIIPPRIFTNVEMKKLNDATSIIRENELEIINFNKLNNLKFDFSTDLFDQRHLNVYGATKFTLYFSKYLKEHYNLQDHKGDTLYNSWEQEYERFKQAFKMLTRENFDDLLLGDE